MKIEEHINAIISYVRGMPYSHFISLEKEGFKREDIGAFFGMMDASLQDLREGFENVKVLAETMEQCGFSRAKSGKGEEESEEKDG